MKRCIPGILALILVVATTQTASAQLFDKLQKMAQDDETVQKDGNGNYMVQGQGTIMMDNGYAIKGIVKFMVNDPNSVQYIIPDSMKPYIFNTGCVNWFTIDGRTFMEVYYRNVDNDKFFSTFMEMGNKNMDDRMKLFIYRFIHTRDNGELHVEQKHYFQMLELGGAFELNDSKFVPFAKRMSEYTKDCPDVSKKIKDKESGYKVNLILSGDNREVVQRIADEYNECIRNKK